MNGASLGIPRHWWGKIIGGALGLMKGGLGGLFVGVIAGHLVDRFIRGLIDRGRTREVFFQTLFGVLGHVAKADGRVSKAEIAAAEQFMRRLELSADERQEAIRRFNAGKARAWDLEGGMREFVQTTVGQPGLRQMFIEILLEGAATDGVIKQAEQEVLYRVARTLRIPTMVFVAMVNAFRATHGGGGYRGPQASAASLDQAYATLGVEPTASEAEIKRAYRRLVAKYHPDRLTSTGMPEEMIEKSKDRAREINIAYDAVKAARGIK